MLGEGIGQPAKTGEIIPKFGSDTGIWRKSCSTSARRSPLTGAKNHYNLLAEPDLPKLIHSAFRDREASVCGTVLYIYTVN